MNEVSENQPVVQAHGDAHVPLIMDVNSVGGRLAQAREQRGWTVQYVAEQLKLSQTQILALEADQLEKLPKLVIVRGFVRAYSKLLRIDAEPLMSLLPQDSEPVHLETSLRPALSTPFIESRTSLSGHQENNRRYMVGMLVLLLVVAVILFFQRTDYGQSLQAWIFGGGAKTPASTEVSAVPAAIELPATSVNGSVPSISMAQNTASGASDAVASAASLAQQNQEVNNAPAMATSTASTASVAVNAERAPQAAAPASTASVPALALAEPVVNSNDALVLKFKQDSWIFVKADGGAVLSSHLAKAGTEETFAVKQGLFMKIGNAAGVEASLRGKPLVIVPERDSKVANVSVK